MCVTYFSQVWSNYFQSEVSSSAAWVCATSDQSSAYNESSLRRNDSFVSSAEATRSYWVSLRENDLVRTSEHWRAEDWWSS